MFLISFPFASPVLCWNIPVQYAEITSNLECDSHPCVWSTQLRLQLILVQYIPVHQLMNTCAGSSSVWAERFHFGAQYIGPSHYLKWRRPSKHETAGVKVPSRIQEVHCRPHKRVKTKWLPLHKCDYVSLVGQDNFFAGLDGSIRRSIARIRYSLKIAIVSGRFGGANFFFSWILSFYLLLCPPPVHLTCISKPKALMATEVCVVITSSVYVNRMGNQVEANMWTVDLRDWFLWVQYSEYITSTSVETK